MMSQTFNLDGKTYSIDDLSDSGKRYVETLQGLEEILKEKSNLIALFTKAKKAYISDLKSEILANKAGFDFSD